MSRTNIKAPLNTKSPDAMLRTADGTIKKHKAMGEESPLHHYNMTKFETTFNSATKLLAKGRAENSSAEGIIENAYQLIGIDDDQTSRTKGTLYNLLDRIRTTLLGKYKGREEQLEQWGFTVVITETVPGRKTKRIEVIIPKGSSFVANNVVNGSSATNTGKVPLAIWEGTGPMPPVPVEIDSGNSWTVAAPSGILTIRNFSSAKTGRCKLTVKK